MYVGNKQPSLCMQEIAHCNLLMEQVQTVNQTQLWSRKLKVLLGGWGESRAAGLFGDPSA